MFHERQECENCLAEQTLPGICYCCGLYSLGAKNWHRLDKDEYLKLVQEGVLMNLSDGSTRPYHD